MATCVISTLSMSSVSIFTQECVLCRRDSTCPGRKTKGGWLRYLASSRGSASRCVQKDVENYHAYLKANLEFPFKAKVEDLDGEATISSLFALNDCPDLTFYGLFVRGIREGGSIEIPYSND